MCKLNLAGLLYIHVCSLIIWLFKPLQQIVGCFYWETHNVVPYYITICNKKCLNSSTIVTKPWLSGCRPSRSWKFTMGSVDNCSALLQQINFDLNLVLILYCKRDESLFLWFLYINPIAMNIWRVVVRASGNLRLFWSFLGGKSTCGFGVITFFK